MVATRREAGRTLLAVALGVAPVLVGCWGPPPALAQSAMDWRQVYLPLALARAEFEAPSSATPEPWSSATDRPPSATPGATVTSAATATATPSPTAELRVDGPRVTTAHYDLWVEGLDGAEVGRLLEAAWPAWRDFFQAEPEGRLPAKVYANVEGMRAGMAADGLSYGGGGGYYHPGNRTFYAFVQPSAYFTRMLILHEATHQFHYLAATANLGYAGFWYGEGLAEHFGMHNWDGSRLETGVIPAISLEDYSAQALAELDAQGRDLASLVADKPGWTRASGWGLVSWLLDERAAGAAALFARLNAREDPSQAWAAVFGPPAMADAQAYRVWLSGHQQPWREVWRAFEQRGDALVGSSGVNALAVRKATAAGRDEPLAVSLEPLSGPLRAGLVLGFSDAQHFVVVQLLQSRDVWVFRMTPAGWQWVTGGRAADRVGERDRLSARRAADGGWTAAINGVDVVTVPDEGLLGLNVDGCTVAFRPE